MTRISILTEKTASPSAVPILAGMREKMGKVFNFHGAVANSPAALQAFMAYDRTLEEQGTLSMVEKEAIALSVSEANQAPYCVGAHMMMCKMIGIGEEDALAYRSGLPADAKIRALCGFVQRVLASRGGVAPEDLGALRDAGYADAQLVEIHAHVAKHLWTNYFTRVFDVELDVPAAPPLTTASFEVSSVVPGTSAALYNAWLDGAAHSAFTGMPASIDARTGGRYSAFGGALSGTFLELAPGERIVATWRNKDFPASAADSKIDVRFDPAPGGTKITVTHRDVPASQREQYETGWAKFYFEPMKQYFAQR